MFFRALEGIKDKLRLLSSRTGADEDAGKQGDMVAICDLADDVRDAVTEYQVSVSIPPHTPSGSLIEVPVFATKSNIRAKL